MVDHGQAPEPTEGAPKLDPDKDGELQRFAVFGWPRWPLIFASVALRSWPLSSAGTPVEGVQLLLADMSRRELTALTTVLLGVVANQMVAYDGRAGAWAAIQETIAELITEEGSA